MALDSNKPAMCLFLDLVKAFDTVDHVELCRVVGSPCVFFIDEIIFFVQFFLQRIPAVNFFFLKINYLNK